MYHKAPARYRQPPLMTVSRPWSLTITLLLFITLALMGTRLPRLTKAKSARPRPASKALIEVPAKALKSLKGYLAGIPDKRMATDQPFTCSALLGATPLARGVQHRPDRVPEPLPSLLQLPLQSRAPPAAT